MLSRPLSPTYARRCLTALRAFAQPGDSVVALCPTYEPTASCGLCQRPAIYRCFPIQNLRTSETLLLGVECIQAYRTLAKKLRKARELYRDPGAIPTILKRYRNRGALTEEQELDFLSACHAAPGVRHKTPRGKKESANHRSS